MRLRNRSKKSKRASLNLSVEAIVILILAITLLGLGLGFIREKFGSTTQLINDVSASTKQRIKENLLNSNNKLSFPATELRIERGKSLTTAFGVKNLEDTTRDFEVELICYNNDGTLDVVDPNSGEPNCASSNGQITFTYGDKYEQVSPGDFVIVPFKIESAGSLRDTYQFKVRVKTDLDGDGTPDVYDTQSFFVTII